MDAAKDRPARFGSFGSGRPEKNEQVLRFVADSQPYFVFRPPNPPKTIDQMQNVLFEFFDGLSELILDKETVQNQEEEQL